MKDQLKEILDPEYDEYGVEAFYAGEKKGLGVRATRKIQKGEPILVYKGDVMEFDACKARWNQLPLEKKGSYLFFFEHAGEKLCVDATEHSRYKGRLLNHSRTHPNVYPKLEVDKKGKPHIVFYALTDIVRQGELLFDYGETDEDILDANKWLNNS